jgi:hypothetical protein
LFDTTLRLRASAVQTAYREIFHQEKNYYHEHLIASNDRTCVILFGLFVDFAFR